MAERVSVMLVDDYDKESAAHETVDFAVDGCNYEIDLNEEHASQLRADIGQWASHARRVTAGRARGRARARMPVDEGAAIREWARCQGHVVAVRGRIPRRVIDEYKAAVGVAR